MIVLCKSSLKRILFLLIFYWLTESPKLPKGRRKNKNYNRSYFSSKEYFNKENQYITDVMDYIHIIINFLDKKKMRRSKSKTPSADKRTPSGPRVDWVPPHPALGAQVN